MSMNTSTSKSAFVKESKESIHMLGNSFILTTANSDIKIIKFTTET